MNTRFAPVSVEIATQFSTVPEHLYLSDENEDLQLIHYADMKNWKRIKPADDVLPYRGWVVDKATGKVVARSFEWTPEYIVEDIKDIKTSQCTLGSHGTILRAFWHGDSAKPKFYISTHRRLSCEKSKWNRNVTFYSMVKDAEERMNVKLEEICKPGYCYVLLLIHPDNQMIRSKEKVVPTIYHLDTWREGTESDEHGLIRMIHDDSKLPLPSYDFLNQQQVEEAIHNETVIITREGNGKTIKYVPKKLQHKIDLRGQNPNIYYSWFMWLHTKQQEEFEQIVPEHQLEEIKGFKERYQKEKKDLEDYLYQVYTERTKELHPVHYNVVKKLHELFAQRRDSFYANPANRNKKFFWGPNKIETEKNIKKAIESLLIQSDTTTLYKAITEHKKLVRLEAEKKAAEHQ